MADHSIDKNSKLFQKFLQAKSMKHSNNAVDKLQSQPPEKQYKHRQTHLPINDENTNSLNVFPSSQSSSPEQARNVFRRDDGPINSNRGDILLQQALKKVLVKNNINFIDQQINDQIDSLDDQIQKHPKNTAISALSIKQYSQRSRDSIDYNEILKVQKQTQTSQLFEKNEKLIQQANQTSLALQINQLAEKRKLEFNSWKSQNQLLKREINVLRSKLNDAEEINRQRQIENKGLNVLIANKNEIADQLRKRIAELMEQNYMAKDYLYNLTLRLYNSEQQLVKLKSENRNTIETSHHNQSVQSTPFENRARQFSRQRSIKRIQTNSTCTDWQNDRKESPKIVTNMTENQTTNLTRIQQIQKQLNQIYQMKSITGKTRRRKIELERQLEALTSH